MTERRKRILPVVTFERPRCPECGHFRLKKTRSITDQGDGSSVAWVRCERCEHRFKVVLE